MFEALSEVDAKHAKNCQREYEAANELAGKFFKRTAVRPSSRSLNASLMS